MLFNAFRRTCQDYCEEYGIRLLSKVAYKQLWREYEASLLTAPVPDNEITMAQFLDTKDLEMSTIDFNQLCVSTFNTVVPQKWPSPKKARCVEAEKEQEGNIPMNCNTNSERSYLQSRISNIRYVKSFRAMFNLDVSPYPQTYKDLIDWIKADKFTLDTKRTTRVDLAVADGEFFGSVFDGINFTALPTPDRAGYDKAVKDDLAQYQAALDVIMTSDATAGLKALNDYAAWMPTVATPAAAPTA